MTYDSPAVADVTVQPSGIRLVVRGGESVIEAAWRAGYYWPTVCGGRAECTACFARVLSGGDDAPRPDDLEARQLERVRSRTDDPSPIRLACCFRPIGSVVVEKKGVRPKR